MKRYRNSWASVRMTVLLLATLGGSFVGGCAQLSPASPEGAVRQRAEARWAAVIAGDVKAAYSYMQPSYRALHDIKYFGSSFGGGVQKTSAEVVSVECQPELCKAFVRIDANVSVAMMRNQPLTTHYEEKWVLEDGAWWYFQKD